MKILIAVDGSELSLDAVRHALHLLQHGLQAGFALASVQEAQCLDGPGVAGRTASIDDAPDGRQARCGGHRQVSVGPAAGAALAICTILGEWIDPSPLR